MDSSRTQTDEDETPQGAVVVGIDGSPAGQEALRWALREARLRTVPLRVVHAWTFGYAGLPVGGLGTMASATALPASGLARSDMREAAEDLLHRATAELAGDFEDVKIEQDRSHGLRAVRHPHRRLLLRRRRTRRPSRGGPPARDDSPQRRATR